MGVLRRRNVEGRHGLTGSDGNHKVDEELQEQAQEVMKDHLTMMRDVVMRIREDQDFAKGIYKDCPRFQHLLIQYPDLRPVFENPKLVRINFESVYKEAGGVLPEDEVEKKSLLVRFVQSPIFKFLKLLLFLKKVFACIAGGGVAFIVAYVTGCCWEDPPVDDIDGDMEIDEDPTKEALNRAAAHMEDPYVQDQMQLLLEDPDNMEEVIANDEQLRELQESNPVCEELMTDPETMKVLTDPDNLRALGECTELIEADFMDPDSFTPEEFETVRIGDYADIVYEPDAGEPDYGDTYGEFDVDVEGDDQDEFDAEDQEHEEESVEEDEEEKNIFEDGELEAREQDNQGGKGGNRSRNRAEESGAEGRNSGGVMASLGAAATDLVAGALFGSVFGDSLEMGGGGDELGGAGDVGDGLEDGVAEAGEAAEDATEGVDGKKEAKRAAAAGAVAGGALIAGGAALALHRNGASDGLEADDGLETEEDTKPKKRVSAFKKVKNAAAFIGATAKEHVASSLLGDDWGDALVDRKDNEREEKKSDHAENYK
eukprot:scaffold683_cov124-Cylindrotheca_fusiformis.AAC.6